MLTNSEKTRIVDYYSSILKNFYNETIKSNRKVYNEKMDTIEDILYILGYEIIGCSEEGTQIITKEFTSSSFTQKIDLKNLYSEIIENFYTSEDRYVSKSKLETFNRILEILGYELNPPLPKRRGFYV